MELLSLVREREGEKEKRKISHSLIFQDWITAVEMSERLPLGEEGEEGEGWRNTLGIKWPWLYVTSTLHQGTCHVMSCAPSLMSCDTCFPPVLS